MTESFVWICLSRQIFNNRTEECVSSVHKSKEGALFHAANKYMRAEEERENKDHYSTTYKEVKAFATENADYFMSSAQFEDDTGAGFQFYKEHDKFRFLVYKMFLSD